MSIGTCIWYRQEHGIGNSNSTTTKKDLGILNAEPKTRCEDPKLPKIRPKSDQSQKWTPSKFTVKRTQPKGQAPSTPQSSPLSDRGSKFKFTPPPLVEY